MWRRWLAVLTVAAALIAGLLAIEISQSAKAPNQQQHHDSADRKAAENAPFYHFWEWSTHDAVAFFTMVLAFFTGALVIVSGIQIRFLIRADRTAKTAADAARDNANAALLAAEAGSRQADHMLYTRVTMEDQARAAKDAAEAAQRNVNLLHALERPYVFVELGPRSMLDAGARIRWHRSHPTGDPSDPQATRTQRPGLDYQLVNPGKTPAIVKAMSVKLQLLDADNSPVWSPPPKVTAGTIVIPSGGVYPEPTRLPGYETVRFNAREQFEQPFSIDDWRYLARGIRKILLVGRLIYEDVFRVEHETAICWRYNPDTSNFEEEGGSQYNYRT